METLKYMRCSTDEKGRFELVVQLSGGGASQAFAPGADVAEVAYYLELLTERLERGAVAREAAA